jgi:ATP-binding cassette subfamily B multidrug efflux pump
MSILRRLMGYIARNRLALAATIFCIAAATYIELYIPRLSGRVIDEVVYGKDYETLKFLTLQVLVFTAVLGVIGFVRRYANTYFSQRVINDIRNDVFASLQKQSFAFYDKTQTGQLVSRTTTDVRRIQGFVAWQIPMIVGSMLTLVGALMVMFSMDLELTLLILMLTPPTFLSIYQYGKKTRPIWSQARKHYGVLTTVLDENLAGMRVVRAFAREKFEEEKFETPNTAFFDTNLAAIRIRALWRPLTGLFMGLGVVIIFWYGGMQVMRGRLLIGDLTVFGVYLFMLMMPMWGIAMMWGGYQRMAAAAERVFEIIDAVPEVKDKPDAIELPPIKGHVRFHGVSFGYDKDRLILKDVELEAEPGQTIALLGPTGSGKSTIIRLLSRFYDVTSGQITVDGNDIRDVRIKSLRSQIGIVSQETFLFATTLRDNIAYGKPDATMEEIIESAEIARIHEFIASLPKGYDTFVGERGVTLSGGQQQRAAIARALLMDPKILILDDSTSSVDVDTEYEIQQALAALFRDRTTFVITQRLSTIRNADKIVVLENGRVAEEGSHELLMKKKGAYYRIYETLYEAQQPVIMPEASKEAITKRRLEK